MTDANGTGEFGADRAELEDRIILIWQQVLRQPDISPDADFAMLGGNSLQGMRLMSQVSRQCGVRVPVAAFLDYPTPAALAGYVATLLDGTAAPDPR